MLKLNENYRIIYDESNVILQFFEMREKQKKDNTIEIYEFTDNYYYPTLKGALNAFLNKYLEGSKSVEEVMSKISDVEKIILTIN